jgi:2-oxoisovalerate dehydrogenase E2 component (dihydrolipoyl transacylase)
MAKTIIELPQVGESVTQGVISKWLVTPGTKVGKYDPLVEVMTDKVNMEVPSPFAGTFIRALVEEGDTVPMGHPIAEIDTEGERTAASVNEPVSGLRAPATTVNFEFVDSVRSVGPTGSGERGEGRLDALQDAANTAKSAGSSSRSSGGAMRLSPLVKRLIEQHRVDASMLSGTGVGGRITKEDVLALVEPGRATERVTAGTAATGPTIPYLGIGKESDNILQLTPLRKTIAAHMERSAREIPAAWSMFEVNVTGLVAYRTAHRDAFAREAGVPLTYLPFAAHAVAQALMANALLNARWSGTGVALNDHVNLGIAVSTEAGLMVPVIHNADKLGVRDLALRVHALIEAARAGKLKLEDVQGGTFTLNNTGALGSVISAPIINHPQAAIMTTEAIIKRPVVVADDGIAVRSMMNLCMTFDHRVCDGVEAGAFLADVKTRLETIAVSSSLL